MLDAILRILFRALLSLRYRIEIVGLDRVAAKDSRGMLFLPNHPALIDPVILLCYLTARFLVRALADRKQIDRRGIRWLAERVQVRVIGDPKEQGRSSKHQIAAMLRDIVRGLRGGEALVLYPAGRIYRQYLEDLGGNSAVEFLVRACPDVRIVLVRTHGLWGSAFGRASGSAPTVGNALKRGLVGLLESGIFFLPRRHVRIEFVEPTDFPRNADRATINRYLESFYNQGARRNTYVPYSIWERGRTRVVAEPDGASLDARLLKVPETTRALVETHLRELTGVAELTPELRLANDLGLDSLARVELQTWIEGEFGFAQSEGDALETVADVMLAACGEAGARSDSELEPITPGWYRAIQTGPKRYLVPNGETITSVFLQAARRQSTRVVVADQNSGTRSYRDLLTAILLMRDVFRTYEGEYLGIMLPASVAAVVTYFAALFAGKTPVLVNWTVGPRGVEHGLRQLGVERVVSARKLFQKLDDEGFGEAAALKARVEFLEDVAKGFGWREKLSAALRVRTKMHDLDAAPCPETIAVLFTSGSESLPKAVPLTSGNVLCNLRDVLGEIEIERGDALLAMLPPFHSFGLTVNVLLPLLTGLPVVYHANPTESGKLAALIEAYRVSVMAATPTFLGGILRAARPGQLDSLRLTVTGAERCPAHVYDTMAERCPRVTVLEGYGITECSPVVSVNRPSRPSRETIGELLPSVSGAIVDPETMTPVNPGERGLLLVRGQSVFRGYLHYSGESPFVQYDGQSWYRTGDLVASKPDGTLVFLGRLKRFVKLGGEIISLPAIESVLEAAFPAEEGGSPTLAVEATAEEERSELVLFSTRPLDRETVNRHLRQAGLSPLHHIRRVVVVDVIPLLGTGKTDYRTLKAQLARGARAEVAEPQERDRSPNVGPA